MISAHEPGSTAARLRVLRLSPAIYRDGVWPVAYDPVGGLQVQVWRITEHLAKLGVEQVVLTTHIPGSPRIAEPFPDTVVRSVGPWLPRFMGRLFLNLGWFLGLLPELLFRARRYDIAHIHLNHSVWCRAAALVARVRGLPTVVSLNTSLWGGSTGLPARLGALIERLALASSSRVLALTSADAERKVRELKLDRRDFVIVPDAIDADRFAAGGVPAASMADFRARHRIPDHARIVAYVGRISPEKGWMDLPRTLDGSLGEPVFLLVCGDGRDRRKLEATLTALRRPECWRITGFVSPEEVRTVLHIADVLVLPSRREAFGSVLLEAMASGLPSVAYAVGGVAEVAGSPAAVRLVQPGDPAQFLAAIRDVLSNAAARDELVAREADRVRDFAVDAIAAATLAVYRSVAAGPAPAPGMVRQDAS
jgi:glycosyltransferase involved in cell wall biosynthesis